MEEGLKSLFTVVVCEGKQVDAGTGMLQRTKQGGTDTIHSIADGRGGGMQTRCDSEEEKWREEVNRQCHSRNRTTYIYINSLL